MPQGIINIDESGIGGSSTKQESEYTSAYIWSTRQTRERYQDIEHMPSIAHEPAPSWSTVKQKNRPKKNERIHHSRIPIRSRKSPRGKFRFTRPDDLAAHAIKHLMASVPNLAPDQVDDAIVGNATPEAEQGLNIGRTISLMGLNEEKVPGMTVNRYCSSGSETIAIASAKIHSGMADAIIAGGVECMSPIPSVVGASCRTTR